MSAAESNTARAAPLVVGLATSGDVRTPKKRTATNNHLSTGEVQGDSCVVTQQLVSADLEASGAPASADACPPSKSHAVSCMTWLNSLSTFDVLEE